MKLLLCFHRAGILSFSWSVLQCIASSGSRRSASWCITKQVLTRWRTWSAEHSHAQKLRARLETIDTFVLLPKSEDRYLDIFGNCSKALYSNFNLSGLQLTHSYVFAFLLLWHHAAKSHKKQPMHKVTARLAQGLRGMKRNHGKSKLRMKLYWRASFGKQNYPSRPLCQVPPEQASCCTVYTFPKQVARSPAQVYRRSDQCIAEVVLQTASNCMLGHHAGF